MLGLAVILKDQISLQVVLCCCSVGELIRNPWSVSILDSQSTAVIVEVHVFIFSFKHYGSAKQS